MEIQNTGGKSRNSRIVNLIYERANSILIPMTPNCVDIVPFGPELTPQKLLFHLRIKLENLLRRDAFDRLNDLARTHRWNTLDQEMNMIFVGANFNEFNLIALPYLKAYLLQALIYCLTKNNSAIFRRAYKVVQKY